VNLIVVYLRLSLSICRLMHPCDIVHDNYVLDLCVDRIVVLGDNLFDHKFSLIMYTNTV
jgi:hypothetical protein